jgi:REP element-mobilizing transposase RayT
VATVDLIARRLPPIDPYGYYHVSSRGVYGRTLFHEDDERELFLGLYERAARKYRWNTLAWALMRNHHHFLISLSEGGLSEGMREVNCGYSRRLNEKYGETGQGHLVKHCFYGGHLETVDAIVAVACYIDLNPARAALCARPTQSRWTSYRANVGLEHPRPFHQPSALLRLIDPTPAAARTAYRRHVLDALVSTSDEGDEAVTTSAVVESAA